MRHGPETYDMRHTTLFILVIHFCLLLLNEIRGLSLFLQKQIFYNQSMFERYDECSRGEEG